MRRASSSSSSSTAEGATTDSIDEIAPLAAVAADASMALSFIILLVFASVASLPARRGTSLLSPEAANRSLVNWGEEVVSVLQEDPLVPGLHFDAIQKRLALQGYERKWFELRH